MDLRSRWLSSHNSQNHEDIGHSPSPFRPPSVSPHQQHDEASHVTTEDVVQPGVMAGQNWKSSEPLGTYSTDLMGNLRLPLLQYTDYDADTLVYIDSAPQHPQPRYRFPPTPSQIETVPHRIHSHCLSATKSNVFRKHFEPRTQARTRKRRGFAEIMPNGIKHIVDLTPAAEGDDAIIFMQELSCPMGIRKWARYEERWDLPSLCVGGQDEVEWLPGPQPSLMMPQFSAEVESSTTQSTHQEDRQNDGSFVELDTEPYVVGGDGILPQSTLQEADDKGKLSTTKLAHVVNIENLPKMVPGLPLDYSPIRHRTCIERILHALEGQNPKLDTAPKMWTFFALAKLFGIASIPSICDWIVRWLLEQNNSLFIEINPELSYRIACGIQTTDICRDTFAILVGEEALLLLHSTLENSVPTRSGRTIHGRIREDLDDTEIQRIEYASKHFMERMLESFIGLVGRKMQWVVDLINCHLRGGTTPENMALVTDLTQTLKAFIRTYIYLILQSQSAAREEEIRSPDNDGLDYPNMEYLVACASMPSITRVLTRTFWKAIELSNFPFGSSTSSVTAHISIRGLAPHLPGFKEEADAKIRRVQRQEVLTAVNQFNLLMETRGGSSDTSAHHPLSEAPPAYSVSEQQQPYFNLWRFEESVASYLTNFAKQIQRPPDPERVRHEVQLEMVDTLACLDEEEFKFLPLWAGGNDDDTGGVFLDPDIPILEAGGFSAPGPAVHTGSAASDATPSTVDSFSTIHPSEAASTVQRASYQGTGGYQTETDVISVGSARSLSTTDKTLMRRVHNLDLMNEIDLVTDMAFEETIPAYMEDVDMNGDDEDDDDDDDDDDTASISSDTIGAASESQLDLDEDDESDSELDWEQDLDIADDL